jgi:hypothetical protein
MDIIAVGDCEKSRTTRSDGDEIVILTVWWQSNLLLLLVSTTFMPLPTLDLSMDL